MTVRYHKEGDLEAGRTDNAISPVLDRDPVIMAYKVSWLSKCPPQAKILKIFCIQNDLEAIW